ncbi:MutH/Sau3AI family endonuclease [Sphingobacterium sp. SYP-B4668]|uniref:MutH/Sau3AI family endonuclease n=1 Tax=Sphingobacterium sp. SYP-B4668 TaxID=2996035 RepID=UPI0022DDE08B|nr:MutH/Sau3AI family endonuclease [Sphingobacterium sp. SYP-B4668]
MKTSSHIPAPLPYDKQDKESILRYAQKLIGKSLREELDIDDGSALQRMGKGRFGNMVEELYFKYSPNSAAYADFPEAGLELKTTPLKQIGKGLSSKERLVFNIINYMEEYKATFATSSFWIKNKELLLLFYLHDGEQIPLDYCFKIVRLWRFPVEDLKIIIDDWNTIVNKIREGRAHELSEGDTLYLGACTKGASKNSMREQPFSSVRAMQRAFSLKSKYLNFIIEQSFRNVSHIIDENEYEYVLREDKQTHPEYSRFRDPGLQEVESAVKSVDQYRPGQTFEELVQERFDAYLGWSDQELMAHFDLQIIPSAKNRYKVICNRILGVKGKRIAEFEKADVEMKTIVLDYNGALRESMSFQQIKYKDIVDEQWSDSYFYHVLSKRFFFVVFQKDAVGEPCLLKVFFWTMPTADLQVAKLFWEDTKTKIIRDDFENFIKIADRRICHVRPKGRDANDLMETASGRWEKKKAYWLNSGYIKKIVTDQNIASRL